LKLIKEYQSGVKLLKVPLLNDDRGSFCKIYNDNFFKSININFTPQEHFYSISKKNVLRGMHFQVDKASHTKLISCISGKILDVIVDVRKNSKFFNKPLSFNLCGESGMAIFIPKGYAHGFLSFSEISIVQYMVSRSYEPTLDKGIKWNSIDFEWPCKNPLISSRDNKHPNINNQNFIFEP
tara:strand:+ start:2544 stop:3086 length:543 start_codon:yes stop_codon:yes gene_type:complete